MIKEDDLDNVREAVERELTKALLRNGAIEIGAMKVELYGVAVYRRRLRADYARLAIGSPPDEGSAMNKTVNYNAVIWAYTARRLIENQSWIREESKQSLYEVADRLFSVPPLAETDAIQQSPVLLQQAITRLLEPYIRYYEGC